MNIKVLGGGPAGLYLAYLLKRQQPSADVTVFEQNANGETFGFGVVFSDKALEFLGAADAETLRLVTEGLETWRDIEVRIHGQSVRIDGIGFTAIARLRLLDILRQRAISVGVNLIAERVIRSLNELGDADVIVGADGANSLVRRTYEDEFGTEVVMLKNHFAWFGTPKTFDCLTQTFKVVRQGYFNAHHYRYSQTMSTFLIEVDKETFDKNGFAGMTEEESREYCQHVFAEELEGHPLIANRSLWRRFPKISNRHYSVGNCVLVGDALRTAHFSIGSGTRLALEDVQALATALSEHADCIPDALASFDAMRRPAIEKMTHAAALSAEWYDHFVEHMQLEPWPFVMDYIGRSGRIDRNRLKAMSPRFVAGYEEWQRQSAEAV